MFLNNLQKISIIPVPTFPSPVGELCFSILPDCFRPYICFWFPSPVGELCFSIEYADMVKGVHYRVSVPCRGAMFLNLSALKRYLMIRSLPFPSPVGELCFSMENTRILQSIDGKFPSPVGELCFSIRTKQVIQDFFQVSVPCRGAMFLNKDDDEYNSWEWCFRPLSGSYVSQLLAVLFVTDNLASFRPLSGSYVSQSSLYEHSFFSILVSVPCRGAMFLNVNVIPEKSTEVYSFRPLSGSYVSQSFKKGVTLAES